MCGICGFISYNTEESSALFLLKKMGEAIATRGPDDSGEWFDNDSGIGLSHRRLSILDLSPAGHQPMVSASGRYILVFNGEIYNHKLIRTNLKLSSNAPNWKGTSDTETLLAGFDTWGIQTTIEKSIGMFTVAVLDRQSRTLTLGRDRLGEKPLYYGWQDGTFLFGSELKALRSHPAFKNEIDRSALSQYMRYSYVPGPYSIYNGISKLKPGNLLTVSSGNKEPTVSEYWSAKEVINAGLHQPYKGNTDEAITSLHDLLIDAVGQQMVADVPLGAFLSGGVDSSVVVALMQIQSNRPVRTFSVGFHEALYNEAPYAKAVAKHLGTDHTEFYLGSQDLLGAIPRLGHLYDEPFADSSQIPTFLISAMARQHVTVVLTGDAGDELFGGYNRYTITKSMWRTLSCLPVKIRFQLAGICTRISPEKWNSFFSYVQQLLPSGRGLVNWGEKIHKSSEVLAANSISELYTGLVSHWTDPALIVNSHSESETTITDLFKYFTPCNDIEKMMAIDLLTYLPDDVLAKVDRAAMGVSLETRVPFLDHRVVEFAWSLPFHLKLNSGVGKWILRQVLYKYVPKELIQRPKQGFGVPIGPWLRKPLRDWAEELLDEKRIHDEGFFDPKLIRVKWQEHLSGQRNWQYHLWDVLMFQSWLDSQKR